MPSRLFGFGGLIDRLAVQTNFQPYLLQDRGLPPESRAFSPPPTLTTASVPSMRFLSEPERDVRLGKLRQKSLAASARCKAPATSPTCDPSSSRLENWGGMSSKPSPTPTPGNWSRNSSSWKSRDAARLHRTSPYPSQKPQRAPDRRTQTWAATVGSSKSGGTSLLRCRFQKCPGNPEDIASPSQDITGTLPFGDSENASSCPSRSR